MSKRQSVFRNALVVFVFLIGTYLYLVKPLVTGLWRDLLLVIIVITAVHLLERILLWLSITDFIKESVREAIALELKDLVGKMADLNERSIKELASGINELVGAAQGAGLVSIHRDREQARQEILEAISEAQKTVWMLGIAFSEKVQLKDFISQLVEKKKTIPSFDAKILLLDPLRSPAIFRTFLESPIEELDDIIESHQRKDKTETNPLFRQRLYADIHQAVDTFHLTYNSPLLDSVRFYAHNPNCWLVIVDGRAYFEPYTFGRPETPLPFAPCIGPYMPVFRFHVQKSEQNAFNMLEDHFQRLWETSDTDLFHFNARWEDRSRIVRKIFDQRLPWFIRVRDVMFRQGATSSTAVDRRRWPRQPCEATPAPTVRIRPQTPDGSVREIEATILNCSRRGLALQLCDPSYLGTLVKGDRVRLSFNPENSAVIARQFINIDLEVQWTSQSSPVVVGLTKVEPDPRGKQLSISHR